jgi:hypothetical protein
MWSNHVVKSFTNRDRRDGVSAGSGACAWTSAKLDSMKKTEKLAVLNILSFLMNASPTAYAAKNVHSELGRCLGQNCVYSRKSLGDDQRRSC